MKEPDFDLPVEEEINLVEEETSIDIESDAIESVNVADPVAGPVPAPAVPPVPAVPDVPDPAVEDPALEPTVEDPLPVPGLPGVPAPAVWGNPCVAVSWSATVRADWTWTGKEARVAEK